MSYIIEFSSYGLIFCLKFKDEHVRKIINRFENLLEDYINEFNEEAFMYFKIETDEEIMCPDALIRKIGYKGDVGLTIPIFRPIYKVIEFNYFINSTKSYHLKLLPDNKGYFIVKEDDNLRQFLKGIYVFMALDQKGTTYVQANKEVRNG